MVSQSGGNAPTVLSAVFAVEKSAFLRLLRSPSRNAAFVCKPADEHIQLCLPVPFTVPQPNVAISTNRTPPLYAGTGLTFTCTVSLDSSVDTDVSVSVTWTGPRIIPGEHYLVMEASGSGGTYTGSLTISLLAEGQDDGQYTCSVTVSGGSSVLEATGSDSTTIDVTGKNFVVITYKEGRTSYDILYSMYDKCIDIHLPLHNILRVCAYNT